MVETYKTFLGPAYFFTTDLSEIPVHTRKAIETKVAVDFSGERLLAACGIDRFASRGNFWVVVTEDRVLSFKSPSLQQNFFSDLTGVERAYTGDIMLQSPGNKSNLFSAMLMPKKELADRMFLVIQARWLAVRGRSG